MSEHLSTPTKLQWRERGEGRRRAAARGAGKKGHLGSSRRELPHGAAGAHEASGAQTRAVARRSACATAQLTR